MKRRIAVMLLCLLAGVGINVLVAWACTQQQKPFYEILGSNWREERTESQRNLSRFFEGSPPIVQNGPINSFGVEWTVYTPEIQASQTFILIENRFGWPFRTASFWDAVYMHGNVPFEDTETLQLYRSTYKKVVPSWSDDPWLHGIHPPWIEQRTRGGARMPIRPLWVGFTLGAMFYGAVLWLMVLAPVHARRSVRRRSGRCTRCGYPLAELTTCPECGSPATPRATGSRPPTD